jgi:hypothetical protein
MSLGLFQRGREFQSLHSTLHQTSTWNFHGADKKEKGTVACTVLALNRNSRSYDYLPKIQPQEIKACIISVTSIPIHFRKSANNDWLRIQERFENHLSSWKGENLSYGGRLTLINSVLSSLPMYMMYFFQIPKGVRKKLDYYRSRFFLAKWWA